MFGNHPGCSNSTIFSPVRKSTYGITLTLCITVFKQIILYNMIINFRWPLPSGGRAKSMIYVFQADLGQKCQTGIVWFITAQYLSREVSSIFSHAQKKVSVVSFCSSPRVKTFYQLINFGSCPKLMQWMYPILAHGAILPRKAIYIYLIVHLNVSLHFIFVNQYWQL